MLVIAPCMIENDLLVTLGIHTLYNTFFSYILFWLLNSYEPIPVSLEINSGKNVTVNSTDCDLR